MRMYLRAFMLCLKKNCCNMQCCGLCSLADTDAQQDDDIQDDQDKLEPPLFKIVTEDLQRYWQRHLYLSYLNSFMIMNPSQFAPIQFFPNYDYLLASRYVASSWTVSPKVQNFRMQGLAVTISLLQMNSVSSA